MPLRKDDSGRRWVEMEFLVPGAPEQVWEAIATGPGMSAWFTPTNVDEREGGAIEFSFGCEGSSSGSVTAWEPPVRFAYEETDWSGEAPPVATEVTITSRAGDQCVVRMVHSLFTSKDDWDDELESFEHGWPGFFAVLRLYLRHFAGEPSAYVEARSEAAKGDAHAWTALTTALGWRTAQVGERGQSVDGAPPLSGEIELVHQDREKRYLVARITNPGNGIALLGTSTMGETTYVTAIVYFYGERVGAIAAEQQPVWSAWLPEAIER